MIKNNEPEELTYPQKLSNVLGVPEMYIEKLRNMGCMNEMAIRNILIKSEYSQLQKSLTVKKRMGVLRERYNLEMRRLQNIVASMKRVYYCKYCGKQISYNRVQHNDGVCAQCVENRIKF